MPRAREGLCIGAAWSTLLLALCSGCADSAHDLSAAPIDAAIERAIGFFAQPPTGEPYALLMLDVMHRRFDIAAFEDSLARYDALRASATTDAALLRVFRRIADHANTLEPGDQHAVTADLDRLTVPALYCDRYPLPDAYPAMLDEAVADGAYLRTHALLALVWLDDNDCALELDADYAARAAAATAELIAVDGVVSDLELEAAAFLHLVGRGDLVDPAFVDEALAQQNDDGGWLAAPAGTGTTGSYWHASITGLMLLLHDRTGATTYPPMLAPPR